MATLHPGLPCLAMEGGDTEDKAGQQTAVFSKKAVFQWVVTKTEPQSHYSKDVLNMPWKKGYWSNNSVTYL